MKAIKNKIFENGLALKNKKFRKGDGVFLLVIGAAIGTLILIGFYILAKDGLGAWGQSFRTLVSL